MSLTNVQLETLERVDAGMVSDWDRKTAGAALPVLIIMAQDLLNMREQIQQLLDQSAAVHRDNAPVFSQRDLRRILGGEAGR